MTQKVCSKCQLTKPIGEFRFLNNRGYYMAECKECERERGRKSHTHARTRPTSRELAAREVAVLCKLFDTGIILDALNLIKDNKV